MAQFISTYKWTDFLKVAKLGQLGRLKNCEISYNSEYLFTFVNGKIVPGGYLRTQTEYNCQTANAVGGESLEQILKEEVAIQ